MFKVTLQCNRIVLLKTFEEMNCYNVELLENLYFKSYAIH